MPDAERTQVPQVPRRDVTAAAGPQHDVQSTAVNMNSASVSKHVSTTTTTLV